MSATSGRKPREGPGIKHVTYYFPPTTLDNAELKGRFEFKPDFLEEKLGIERRYLAAKGDATSDYCVSAVTSLLEQSGVSPDAIDALVIVTLNPDFIMPHTAALVQDRCGLRKDLASFDVALGCSGYVYGLSLVEAMMRAQGFSNAVLVTAVNFWRIINPDDRNTVPLFGDCATATLLSTDDPRYYVGRSTFGTNGGMREAIIVRGSGTGEQGEGLLEMDGRGVFNLMMSEVPPDVRRCLELNQLSPDEVTTWLFHQASKYMVKNLAKELKLPPDRIIYDLADGGNTSSCTIPVTLSRRILTQPDAELPDIIGVSGFGVGASWASSFLFKNRRRQ